MDFATGEAVYFKYGIAFPCIKEDNKKLKNIKTEILWIEEAVKI